MFISEDETPAEMKALSVCSPAVNRPFFKRQTQVPVLFVGPSLVIIYKTTRTDLLCTLDGIKTTFSPLHSMIALERKFKKLIFLYVSFLK